MLMLSFLISHERLLMRRLSKGDTFQRLHFRGLLFRFLLLRSNLLSQWLLLRWLLFRHRSSHKGSSVKKGVVRNFTKFAGKHLWQSLFYNKVAGPRQLYEKIDSSTGIYFPVNFVKFLRTPFSQNTSGWLHLETHDYFWNDYFKHYCLFRGLLFRSNLSSWKWWFRFGLKIYLLNVLSNFYLVNIVYF